MFTRATKPLDSADDGARHRYVNIDLRTFGFSISPKDLATDSRSGQIAVDIACILSPVAVQSSDEVGLTDRHDRQRASCDLVSLITGGSQS